MKVERSKCVVFIDIDVSQSQLYSYRKPHLDAASELGYLTVTIAEKCNPHWKQIISDCNVSCKVEALSFEEVNASIQGLESKYQVAAIFCYPGQARPDMDANLLVEKLCRTRDLPVQATESLLNANNKFLMRQVLDSANLPNIDFGIASNLEEVENVGKRIGFPLFCKPVFGAGSSLSTRCDSLHELKRHYEIFNSSFDHLDSAKQNGGSQGDLIAQDGSRVAFVPGKTVLLEGWLEGPEGTLECVVLNGEVFPLILHDKLLVDTHYNTMLERLLVTPPVRFSEADQSRIKAYGIACIKAIGLTDGLVHFEFRMTADGPIVIEINPRLGGFYVDQSWNEVAGLDPYKLNIEICTGRLDRKVLVDAGKNINLSQYVMFVLYPEVAGHVEAVKGFDEVSSWPEIVASNLVVSNQWIDPKISEVFVAKFFARISSGQEALVFYQRVQESIKIIMKPSSNCSLLKGEGNA